MLISSSLSIGRVKKESSKLVSIFYFDPNLKSLFLELFRKEQGCRECVFGLQKCFRAFYGTPIFVILQRLYYLRLRKC